MKKKSLALFTAAAIALQCVIGTPAGFTNSVSSITASASDSFSNAIPAEQAGLVITASDILINGQLLTAGTDVKNGDKLDLNFEWSLPTNFEYVNGTFVYDMSSQLYGIDIGDQVIPVYNNGVITATYTIQDGNLYIQLFEGTSNRRGTCKLEGTIDLEKVTVDSDGRFDLKFINKTSVVAPSKVAGLWTAKDPSGTAYFDTDGKLYQKFTITVGSNNVESTNVVLTDTYGGLYTRIVPDSITVNGNTTAAAFNDANKTFTINIGTVKNGWSNETKVTYIAELDAAKALAYAHEMDSHSSEITNTVTVTSNENNTATDDARYTITMPSIRKSGAYDATNDVITWTVTVDPGVLSGDTFNVTDYIDNELNLGGYESFDQTKMTQDPDTGIYTVTYTTSTSSIPDSPFPTSVKNTATVDFDDINTDYTATSTVTIPGTLDNFVDKSHVKSGDIITWTVKVNVPLDVDLTEIVIRDDIYANDYASYNTYIETNKTVSAMNSDLTLNSFKLDDGNGHTYTLSEISSANIGYCESYHKSPSHLEVYLNDAAFLRSVQGKTITVTYNTQVADTVPKCNNTAKATLKYNTDSTYDTDDDEYINEFSVKKDAISKEYYYCERIDDMQLAWGIWFTMNDPKVGEQITVIDTLPEGYTYAAGSARLDADNDYWNLTGDGMTRKLSVDTSTSGIIKFTVTIDQEIIDLFSTKGYNTLRIVYMTLMTDDEFIDISASGNSRAYTNDAVVTYNSLSHNLQATQTVTPIPEKILKKGTYGSLITNSDGVFINYAIDVNAEAVELNGGDPITLVDQLGTNLELVEDSVTIDFAASDAYVYDTDANTITFTVSDCASHTINYKAKIIQIGENDTITSAEAEEKFSNTVTMIIKGDTEFTYSKQLSDDDYRSQGSFEHDDQLESISISGTKMWEKDDDHTGVRPAEIAIKLTCKKYGPSSDAPISTTTQELKPTIIDIDSDGNWSYEITNLTTKDTSGNTYEYDVAEVAIDGYSVAYSGDTTKLSGTGNKLINLTNTFTAAENEVGSVKITKTWANDTSADRPDEITFTIEDETGKFTQTKTVSSSTATVTFEKLPLFIYSRGADGKLTRELRRYTLTESTISGYTSSLTGNAFTLSEGSVTAVAVTNTKTDKTPDPIPDPVETGSLKITKVWANDTVADRPASISFTVTSEDGAYNVTKPLSSTDTAVTFEGLPLYKYSHDADGNLLRTLKTYTITENAIDGYTTTLPASGFVLLESGITEKTVTNTKMTGTDPDVPDPIPDPAETGSLKITKVWANDTAANRPAAISFTVTSEDGAYNVTKPLSSTDTAVTFEGLPLYKYSHDADGNLLRTFIKYTVTESEVSGYSATLPAMGFTLSEADVTTKVVTNTKVDSDKPTPPTPPSRPSRPSYPIVEPDKPVDPPVTPDEPVEPPVTPDEPVKPPVTPDEPVEPPVTPDEPVEPPMTPDEPTTPPEEPENPADPDGDNEYGTPESGDGSSSGESSMDNDNPYTGGISMAGITAAASLSFVTAALAKKKRKEK